MNVRIIRQRPWLCRLAGHRWERVGRDGRHLYDICWRCLKERPA
jgi:hypothetical protein